MAADMRRKFRREAEAQTQRDVSLTEYSKAKLCLSLAKIGANLRFFWLLGAVRDCRLGEIAWPVVQFQVVVAEIGIHDFDAYPAV